MSSIHMKFCRYDWFIDWLIGFNAVFDSERGDSKSVYNGANIQLNPNIEKETQAAITHHLEKMSNFDKCSRT